ncbi:lycopene beta-cyclase CrtY [Sphingosinicellaceae bacterium]|nr:lycopene beta-cyclase CrtY [Sphingosinicellaceae bacterium]
MDYDLILAGGGLHNGLIALRLAALRPELRVAVVEAGPSVGGNHTWSSFARDLTPEQAAWTAPLIAHRWDRYSVRFPRHSRIIDMGYVSATSALLDAAVRAALPADCILTGVPIVALDPTSVTLADQRVLTASAVIDGRGQGPTKALDLRWQKFLGIEVELAADHGLEGPIIMDATVPQSDGYRFVYTLPFGPRHVLIEDTYFSDGDDLAPERLRQHLADYAKAQGWEIVRVIREETGILPIALGGDVAALWAEGEAGVGKVGLRAARFNPATGYSFPDAVRTADLVAGLPDLSPAALDKALRTAAIEAWNGRSLFRLLNKMLFLAAYPHERRQILERFYRLDARLIGRFYASESTFYDRMRILTGKPPIPIPRAVRALLKYEFVK